MKILNEWMNEWMNEFLEQLVRVLTNAYSRSQRMFGERVSPGPTNQRSCHGLPCCWGVIAMKATSPEPSDWLCSVSLPISVFFTHSLRDVLRKRTRDNSKRRGLIACVQTTTPTANFWAQIILDPYRRPLTLTFLLVSTRGLFQDMMFDRLLDSTLSEDASEVLVQPLHCGTKILNMIVTLTIFLLCSI